MLIGGTLGLMGGKSGAIKSIQQVSITIGTGSSSNTATISSVNTSNSTIVFAGFTTTYTGGPSAAFPAHAVFTNSTTVTATRASADATYTVTANYNIIEWNASVIQSKQDFSISLSAATSGTATISSVTTANAGIIFSGFMGGTGGEDRNPILTLTNATTVTVNTSSSTTSTIKGHVIEFKSGVLATAAQSISFNVTAPSTTKTITSVTAANTVLFWNGFYNPSGNPGFKGYAVWATLTNATTITGTSFAANVCPVNLTVFDFKPQYIKSIQRGSARIATSATSQATTISSVSTTKAFANYLGETINGSSLTDSSYTYPRMDLTNATTMTITRNTSTASYTVDAGYEVVEFL